MKQRANLNHSSICSHLLSRIRPKVATKRIGSQFTDSENSRRKGRPQQHAGIGGHAVVAGTWQDRLIQFTGFNTPDLWVRHSGPERMRVRLARAKQLGATLDKYWNKWESMK